MAPRGGRVGRLVLERPGSRNALTTPMIDSLVGMLAALREDDTVDVVALSAVGPDFCSGSDVGDIAAVLCLGPAERARSFAHGLSTTVRPLMAGLLSLPQIVVASARGHAIGLGAALLSAADVVVLSETALVTVPQVGLGHTSDHGECWLLPRRIGLARAMQVSLLGERVAAVDAECFGMANWVTADRDLETRAADVVEAVTALQERRAPVFGPE
ncbi:enoyl-CoA hydratase/isomerase family protein [Pseudonocardia sp. CA-107938]|uniref:enoyl-CoA hydratase/isomerase family protein n=1 Tax=Pseudonocardia sp. CA-107938 TaxID=3240021 RepID=UPI003D8B3C64